MTYAGLKISDKLILSRAEECGMGALYIPAIDCVVDVQLALSQIAEMEKAEKPMDEMTIHGYSVRHLEMIAILMRDHGVTPEDVKEAARNYSAGAMFAFQAASEQIQEGFKKCVERMNSPYATEKEERE